MLVALLGLLRAGFDVVLANNALLKHLPSTGANTLVYERDGVTLDGGTNILFDENWQSFGTKAETENRPLPRSRTEGGNILCFTSGTTGRPKAVVCPQNSWQQRALFPLNSAFASYERILIVPSLATSWGLSRAYEALHAGRTVCLAPPGATMLWLANTFDVDTILASPQQALELAELQEKVTHFPLAALKSFQIGASAIGRNSVQRIKNSICRNVIMIYGSTEAGVVAAAPYDMIADVPGAVGVIVPGVDVEIVDATDRVLPIGSEGFVRVRSRVSRRTWPQLNRQENGFTLAISVGSPTTICFASPDAVAMWSIVAEKSCRYPISKISCMTCFGVQDAGVCTVGRGNRIFGSMGRPGSCTGSRNGRVASRDRVQIRNTKTISTRFSSSNLYRAARLARSSATS